MISSIEITRFRGIREGKLEDLTPLVVLVGPNGCGKSTVLDAILIAASPDSADAVGRVVVRHQGVVEGPRWLFWRGDQRDAPRLELTTRENHRTLCTLRSEDFKRVECRVKIDQGPVNTTDVELAYDRNAAKQAYKVLHRMVAGTSPVTAIRLVDTSHRAIQTPLDAVFSDSARTGLRDEAKAIVGQIVPNMKDVLILTEAGLPILNFEFRECAIPVALSGDGIHALVRAAFELASRPEGVVLFEEPEGHQHPAAIRQTVRAILAAVRRDIQVILTTHSLELIDSLLGESEEADLQKLCVYRLQLEQGLLKSRRIPGTEVAFLRTEIENDLR